MRTRMIGLLCLQAWHLRRRRWWCCSMLLRHHVRLYVGISRSLTNSGACAFMYTLFTAMQKLTHQLLCAWIFLELWPHAWVFRRIVSSNGGFPGMQPTPSAILTSTRALRPRGLCEPRHRLICFSIIVRQHAMSPSTLATGELRTDWPESRQDISRSYSSSFGTIPRLSRRHCRKSTNQIDRLSISKSRSAM